ncbi:MAG: response regulator [candidate division Zixibacteria bacterium]|nr:response regulator [candidate division Zixibacteria bacterium]MDH3936965.1 response regulator [candidate division Zixibacteria bacterium]MDH4035016.1 response regulator [candidate division Zixibacteria bacterium]
MKILIAEDSALIRRGIAKIVTDQGFKPIEAENGAEALAKLRKNERDIALVILDWNMPLMDGYEVLCKIRSQNDCAHIPVLMATSDGAEEDVIKAIKAGANSYLVKPFKPEDMARQINELTNFKAVPKQ